MLDLVSLRGDIDLSLASKLRASKNNVLCILSSLFLNPQPPKDFTIDAIRLPIH